MIVDGVAGKAAVFTGDDDLPLDAPLDHVGRLKFHSALHNIAIVSVHTGTLTLPAFGPAAYNIQSHTLFAHGKSGTPYVEGRITSINGVDKSISLAGSIAVARQSWNADSAEFMRAVHLGANSTNVLLNEFSVAHQTENWTSMTVGWEVFVTDVIFPAGPPATPPQPNVMIDITENRVVLGEGRFDTDNRYIRAGATGSTFEMQKSNTWNLVRGPSNNVETSWKNTTGPSHALTFQSGQTGSVEFSPVYTLARL